MQLLTLPFLFLDGIAWWDEFHLKVRLGHASKYEVPLCRHPYTGEACPEEDGGVWADEMPSTSMKYPGEAPVCAGAVMWKAEEGDAEAHEGYRGKTLPLFNYTGKTAVGLEVWDLAWNPELGRLKPL